MKKIMIMAVPLIFLCACSFYNNNGTDTSVATGNEGNNQGMEILGDTDMEQRVTKDWLKEQYGFSDSDLEGIEVEQIAEALWWTKESLSNEYKKDDAKVLLSVLKSSQKQYTTLQNNNNSQEPNPLWGSSSNENMPEFDKLKLIEFYAFANDGDDGQGELSGYLDIDNNKIYYAQGVDVYYCVVKNDHAGYEEYDISDDEISEIISCMKPEFFENKENIKSVWSAGFQFEDGSVYNYSIKNANIEDDKLLMIDTFFDKMQNPVYGVSFLDSWKENE